MSSSSSTSGIAPAVVPNDAAVDEFLFADVSVEAAPAHAAALCRLVPHRVVPHSVTRLVVALFEELRGPSLVLNFRVFTATLSPRGPEPGGGGGGGGAAAAGGVAAALRFDEVPPGPWAAEAAGKEAYPLAVVAVRPTRALLCAGPASRAPRGSPWRELTRGWEAATRGGLGRGGRRCPAAALCTAVGVVAALSPGGAERVVGHATVALQQGLAGEEEAALWRQAPPQALAGHLAAFLDLSEIPFSASVADAAAWAERNDPLPPAALRAALRRAVVLPAGRGGGLREVGGPAAAARPVVPCVFAASAQLTHVSLGRGLRTVAPSAFSGCLSLRSVTWRPPPSSPSSGGGGCNRRRGNDDEGGGEGYYDGSCGGDGEAGEVEGG